MKQDSIFARNCFLYRMRFIFSSAFFFVTFLSTAQQLTTNSFQLSNTSYDELNPVISPDGRSLYVTVSNHPQNTGGKRDPGDIWVSVLTETNQWSAPVHGGPLLNDMGFNGVAGFSADGSQMFLLGHYGSSGSTARTQGIAVSRSNNNGWSKPENISIPYFQNKSGVLNGYILPDQSVFVFSAETYGSKGVEDIYVCTKTPNGSWSEPKNLGSVINTRFQELSPSLTADGKTLYFSTNGGKGREALIFILLPDWMTAGRTGRLRKILVLQSTQKGANFIIGPYEKSGYALYTSTKNSDGYGDVKIYITGQPVVKDSIPNPPDTVTKIVVVNREPEADKRVKVYGKVTNAKTGESIIADILFTSPSSSQTSQATAEGGLHSIGSVNRTIHG